MMYVNYQKSPLTTTNTVGGAIEGATHDHIYTVVSNARGFLIRLFKTIDDTILFIDILIVLAKATTRTLKRRNQSNRFSFNF